MVLLMAKEGKLWEVWGCPKPSRVISARAVSWSDSVSSPSPPRLSQDGHSHVDFCALSSLWSAYTYSHHLRDVLLLYSCISFPDFPNFFMSIFLEEGKKTKTSLVIQWLTICLSMQRTWVRSLVREDPICNGATKPTHPATKALMCSRAVLHKRSHWSEKPAHQMRSIPCSLPTRESLSNNEDPVQPERINQ